MATPPDEFERICLADSDDLIDGTMIPAPALRAILRTARDALASYDDEARTLRDLSPEYSDLLQRDCTRLLAALGDS